MSFQSTEPVLGGIDLVVVDVILPCYLVPILCYALLLGKRVGWRLNVPAWRQKTWLGGLILGFASSFLGPFFLLGLQFFFNNQSKIWFSDVAVLGMIFALLASAIAGVLLGFGGGKQRTIGILSASLTLVELAVSLLSIAG